MKNTINRTLRENLIVNPKPKCNKKEFFQLYDRIIGNANEFETFLEVTETQKRMESAKNIIDIMVLESNFAPAYILLDEMVEFEKTVRYNRTIQNHSRDHYIHICYLYLLGIYLFFYYPEFNMKLSHSLSLLKTSTGISEQNNFVKSFISAWKYFVLFHDIAYEFEYLGNGGNLYNELELKEKKRIEKIFKPVKIYGEIIDMLTEKVIATLLAIHYTINKTSLNAKRLCAYLQENRDRFEGADGNGFWDECKEENLTYLHYIHTGDDIKYFLTLFENDDFLVAFKRDLKIEGVIYKGKLYILGEVKEDKLIKKIKNNLELVFDDEISLHLQGMSVEYYGVKIKEKYDDFLLKNEMISTEMEQHDFGVKNVRRMKDLVSFFYSKCKMYRTMEVSEEDRLKKFKDAVKKEVFAMIEGEVECEEYKDKYLAGDRIEYEKEYVEKYIKDVRDNCREILKTDMSGIMQKCEKISGEKYIHTEYIKNTHKTVREKIDCLKGENDRRGDIWEYYSNHQYNETEDLFKNNIKQYIENSFRVATDSEKSSSLFDILKQYRLSYSEYDHGITAAIVYLLHFHYYQNIIDYIIDKNEEGLETDSKEIKWLRMCFNIPKKTTNEQQKKYIMLKYKKEYQEIAAQVGYAILVHNLYPSCFGGGKGIMTNDADNPFAYFCMFCDALQNWGRPYNINPLTEKEPLFIDAEKYDISLGECIKVTLYEDRLWAMEKELNNFQNVMGKYLDSADEKIKVCFK
ncbi:MAG: hypothetical protein HDR23_10030 [Lachnospiraceae bacterium]|nr:hypothetical protein [Lachnospiraceae bacterium]